MRKWFNRTYVYLAGGFFILLATVIFTSSSVWAQPSCEWDCTTTDCCSPGYEFMCNGGTYGSQCAAACIGAGAWEAPIGMCL